MTKYRIVEAVHVEDDLQALATAVVLGDNIERALLDRHSPFAMMMDRARDEFAAAIALLIDADLNTPDGVSLARSQQADVRRYRDMCRWIDDALSDRTEAETAGIAADDDEAVPDNVRELHYGERAKPAPFDA